MGMKRVRVPGLLLGMVDGGASSLERRVMALLERRVGWGNRTRVAGVAGCALVLGMFSVGVGMASVRPGLMVMAQLLHATGPLPSFEVVTIRPDSDSFTRLRGANIRNFVGNTRSLIESAYNVPYGADDRVVGGPGWLNSEKYDIEEKIPDEIAAKMQTMSIVERTTEIALMKESLLASRFKLKVHFEMRELPVYELVVAKGGAKLKTMDAGIRSTPFASSGYFDTFGPNNGLTVSRDGQGRHMLAKGMALDRVAQDFQEVGDDTGGRTVVNKTGLTGQYDFTLDWMPEQGAAAPGVDGAAAASEGPSIFTALQEQLGLRLVPAKGMVEVIVIDSIERPTEN